jgi:hypothetical protein
MLGALEPWKSDSRPEAVGYQNRLFQEAVQKAINEIRFRHWRELPESAEIVKELAKLKEELDAIVKDN